MSDDSDSDLGDLLDTLISNDDDTEPIDEKSSEPQKIIKELDFNFLDKIDEVDKIKVTCEENKTPSLIEKDCDTSDDEDNKYFEEQKYSEYGRSIKKLLKEKQENNHKKLSISEVKNKSCSDDITKKVNNNTFRPSPPKPVKTTVDTKKSGPLSDWLNRPSDIYSDPIFGLKIVKPLISSAALQERMRDRTAVTVTRVKHFIATQDLSSDWVIAGVLIQRSATKKSQNGNQYCIWTISDLSDSVNIVSIFLFKDAYKTFWKTNTGVVIGALNPNVLESRNEKDQATLSVDKSQKIMILGNSKDLGRCKSMKKNGDPCNNVVNLSKCEYCTYHVKHEYNKASRRPDLGTDHMNRKFSNGELKPKANNFSSGMYNQANHHNNMLVIPAKRNLKMEQKDSARLALLMGNSAGVGNLPMKDYYEFDFTQKKTTSSEKLTENQEKDLGRLGKIRNFPMTANVSAKSTLTPKSMNVSKKPVAKPSSLSLSSPMPKLGKGITDSIIDFSEPITKNHINSAKANAIKWAKGNGGIKQSNPNKIGQSREKLDMNKVTKRYREEEKVKEEPKPKISKMSDEFKAIMEATSSHMDAIEETHQEDQEKYFKRLEAKERMEEKMINTVKVNCKAVKCLVCQYTAFSASGMCKEKRHPLRVIDAVKSFFKCSDCGNRTVSLDRIPSTSCKKCSSSNWMRTGMMNEKKTNLPRPALSIRGGEEKFIGSEVKDANLDLLIPDPGI